MQNQIFLFILLILMTACNSSEVESESINTSGIWAGMQVESFDGDTVKISVELNVGGSTGTNVVLSGNDRLEVSVDGITQILDRDNDLFDVDYQTNLSNLSENAEVTISLIRTTETSAPNSMVVLPSPFSILSPVENEVFSKTGNVPLSWNVGAQTSEMEIHYFIICMNNTGGRTSASYIIDVFDDGEYSLPLNDVPLLNDPLLDTDQSCSLDIKFERRNPGTLDPAITEGGFISSKQERRINDLVINF